MDRLDPLDLRVPRDQLLQHGPAADLRAIEQDVVPEDRQDLGWRKQQLDRAHDPLAAERSQGSVVAPHMSHCSAGCPTAP